MRNAATASLLAGLGLALAHVPPGAAETTFQGAVIYGLGSKYDKSFNEGIANGIARFGKATGAKVAEFEISNEAQRAQAMERAIRGGAQNVIVAGFDMAGTIKDAAPKFPKVEFTIIDAVVDAPNVRSVVFREEQGSFLVGAIAALTSKTGTIGFVGGMDIPSIRRFECGFQQGAQSVKPDIKVLANMTGTTSAAWHDPARAGSLAQSQFDRGADVVYAAAGASGIGVYQAAADDQKLAIGVDSDQDFLHPGTMLTSMVKRVDEAAYKSLDDAMRGDWKAGTVVYGLAENGVSYAVDEYNDKLLAQPVRETANALREKIIDGKITVHDYVTDNACPAAASLAE